MGVDLAVALSRQRVKGLTGFLGLIRVNLGTLVTTSNGHAKLKTGIEQNM